MPPSAPAKPRCTLKAPIRQHWRVGAKFPAGSRALRGAGRASRLGPAHAARLHFYGGRTIAEVWRVAVCRRNNRVFLFIATLPTCRRVGWAGRRRAWGSPGCPALGGRGRVLLLRPSVRVPLHPAAHLRVIRPHQVLAGKPDEKNTRLLYYPGSQVRSAETSRLQSPRAWGAIYRPDRKILTTPLPHPHPHPPISSGLWRVDLRSRGGPDRIR